MQQISAPMNQTPPAALELKDIHIPEQIANYPTAYGWWFLAALLIVIIILVFFNIRKSIKRNKIKKQALKQLKNTAQMNNNELVSLLKWAAMHYFSRAELAKLFGESLQHFLASQLTIKHQQKFTELSKAAFESQYQPSVNAEPTNQVSTDLHKAAKLWLTHALPAKAKRNHSSIKQGVTL